MDEEPEQYFNAKTEADDGSIMHFGKNRGQTLGSIKQSYLEWLWNQWEKDDTLKIKLLQNNEEGRLARYIRSALNS